MDPLLWIAVNPHTNADQERLADGLQTLTANEPWIRVRTDSITGATKLGAPGEQHLEIIIHRLAREFRVEATTGPLEIAYREAPTRPADGEKKVAAMIRGRAEYAHVKIHLYPGERGSGCIFENRIVGGAIPARFIQPIHEGILGAAAYGVIGGYPVVDVRAELYDGSYHDVDSSELAFQMAASLAFQNAARQAKPILLEPVMQIVVRVAGASVVPVVEGLQQRGAQILSHEFQSDAIAVFARAPLSAMLAYATDLQGQAAGRGSVEMRLDGYEPVALTEDAGPDAMGVPAVPKRPLPRPGPLRIALPEPPDEPR